MCIHVLVMFRSGNHSLKKNHVFEMTFVSLIIEPPPEDHLPQLPGLGGIVNAPLPPHITITGGALPPIQPGQINPPVAGAPGQPPPTSAPQQMPPGQPANLPPGMQIMMQNPQQAQQAMQQQQQAAAAQQAAAMQAQGECDLLDCSSYQAVFVFA